MVYVGTAYALLTEECRVSFFVSLSAMYSTLILRMLQNQSLAILNCPILGSRLYKLNEVLSLHSRKKINLS